MSATTQSSPAQRVPAWKRLGLKLKATPAGGAVQPAAPAPQAANNNNTTSQSGAGSNSPFENGRKRSAPPAQNTTPGNKRVRFDSQESAYHSAPGSFGKGFNSREKPTPTTYAPPQKKAKTPDAAKKKKPTNKKPKTPAPPPGLGNQHLEYLERYKNDRASWKFNTNSQTLLIKYVFVDSLLPASHIDIFYDYLKDLKGMTRTRLLETAREIVQEDQKKNTGFEHKAGGKVDKAAQEKMQAEYDEIIAEFNTGVVNGNGKRPRRISEVDYVLGSANPDVQRRIRRRIRAENVAAELSDSESTTSSGGATTTTSESISRGAGSSTARGSDSAVNGPEEPKKRVRKNKVRNNAVDDDTSSSEEESDEEESEEDSSESSSEEESEDEEMPLAGADDAETSSSSSSSSDEGSEEDDDDDDDDEEGNGGGARI